MEINITLLWQIVLFLLLFVGLSRLLFAPMLAMFDERERRIEGAQREAQALDAQAQQKLTEFEMRLQKSTAAALEELNKLKSEGAQLELQIINEAKTKAKAKIEDAGAVLQSKVELVRNELSKRSNDFSGQMVNKILGTMERSGSSQKSALGKMECSSA